MPIHQLLPAACNSEITHEHEKYVQRAAQRFDQDSSNLNVSLDGEISGGAQI